MENIILETNEFEFEVPQECIDEYPLGGQADAWANEWVTKLNLVEQLDGDLVLRYVMDCGVETAHTMNEHELAKYCLWIVVGNYVDSCETWQKQRTKQQ